MPKMKMLSKASMQLKQAQERKAERDTNSTWEQAEITKLIAMLWSINNIEPWKMLFLPAIMTFLEGLWSSLHKIILKLTAFSTGSSWTVHSDLKRVEIEWEASLEIKMGLIIQRMGCTFTTSLLMPLMEKVFKNKPTKCSARPSTRSSSTSNSVPRVATGNLAVDHTSQTSSPKTSSHL